MLKFYHIFVVVIVLLFLTHYLYFFHYVYIYHLMLVLHQSLLLFSIYITFLHLILLIFHIFTFPLISILFVNDTSPVIDDKSIKLQNIFSQLIPSSIFIPLLKVTKLYHNLYQIHLSNYFYYLNIYNLSLTFHLYLSLLIGFAVWTPILLFTVSIQTTLFNWFIRYWNWIC